MELFKMFSAEKKVLGVSEVTIKNYENSLKRFFSYNSCVDVVAAEISGGDILEFVSHLQEEDLSVAAINHYLRDLRAFFRWCSRMGYMEQLDIKMVKGQESIKETYSEDELKKLLRRPEKDAYCEWRSWAVINWILATGNRAKTVCNVKMQDINIPDGEIILRETKNKRVQAIPMSTELSFVLKQFIRDFRSGAGEEDYLFCNVAGERLTENALKLSIYDYNRSRGVNRTSIHAFRHTFAKMWIQNNGDVFRLQKMLGHATLDMTRNYVNLFSADLKSGFDEYSPLDRITRKSGLKHMVKKKREF